MRHHIRRGFTLIELLTVIAIIAVLAALLFPVFNRAKEQTRQGTCMSNLHNIYIAIGIYKSDNSEYPPALLGLAEKSDGSYVTSGGDAHVYMSSIVHGYLYDKKQFKDIAMFACSDNVGVNDLGITIAHIPPKPPNWPSGLPYIADALSAAGCPSDGFGTIDCFTSGPNQNVPKYYYVKDAYDVGPRVDASGAKVLDASGNPVFDVHYMKDLTGVTGLADFKNQLKYPSPEEGKTLLSYCSWHVATAGDPQIMAITASGSAKKINFKEFFSYGPYYYSK